MYGIAALIRLVAIEKLHTNGSQMRINFLITGNLFICSEY
jgi:hypothetical protein